MEIGFRCLNSMISLEKDREFVINLYYFLRKLIQNNVNDLNIIDRLFKKYLNQNEAEQAISLLIKIQKEYQEKMSFDEFNTISEIIKILNKLLETLIFYKEYDNRIGHIRMIIFNIPYCILDKMQTLEYYDNLSDDDEPYWMRDVSGFVKDNKPLEKP